MDIRFVSMGEAVNTNIIRMQVNKYNNHGSDSRITDLDQDLKNYVRAE